MYNMPHLQRPSFLLGVGAFRPKFYRNGGHLLPKLWYHSIGSWSHYNFATEIFRQRNTLADFCSRFSQGGRTQILPGQGRPRQPFLVSEN